MQTPVRRALLSVSDKTGIVELARRLDHQGVVLLSTGGTAKLLKDAGLPVTDVAEHTGFPEIMDGRVKTLHPKVHGGLLGRRDLDAAVMDEHGIAPIDLLVINLYPFEQTVARPGCTREEGIENIDIGGPAMLRAAAKNSAWVTVLTDPADYDGVLAEIGAGGVSTATRQRLAAKAYARTSAYDAAVTAWLTATPPNPFPATLGWQLTKAQDLRYGENPHQRAAFYVQKAPPAGSLATATQHQGKEMSFNNLNDADAALACVKAFPERAACVIVKHANPCGVALGETIREAYERAHATDPTSAFGGIIAFNRPLDAETARAIVERQFVEVILAPEVSPEALEVTRAKTNVRVVATGWWDAAEGGAAAPAGEDPHGWDVKRVAGGFLVQTADTHVLSPGDMQTAGGRAPTEAETRDLLFAWRVATFVKSNAIVYARDGQTLGIGAGQMSRVDSARIAALKAEEAGLALAGAVMASDAFFPFRDGIDTAAGRGIAAVIQPGGSMRDPEVVAAADEASMAMVFTGVRHFRH